MNFYPSLEAFYCEKEARRRSPEADYGVWWRDDRRSGYCRVSYVQATGEVYALHIGDEQVEVLGVVPPDPYGGARITYARGKFKFYQTLDQILGGWVDKMGEPGGLAWIRERLAQEEWRAK